MDESKSWFQLAEEFLALDPHRSMGVAWIKNGTDQFNFWFEWYPTPILDFYKASIAPEKRPLPNSLIEAKFMALAASAGNKLPRPAGSIAVNSWLTRVVLDTTTTIKQSQQDGIRAADGRLPEICRESAELCYVIEAYRGDLQPEPITATAEDRHVEQPEAVRSEEPAAPRKKASSKRKRTSSMIESPIAVNKLERHLTLIRNKGGTVTRFLSDANISARTLSSVRTTNKARPDTFQGIAKAMKLSYRDLLNE